jgi:hypothetical protein
MPRLLCVLIALGGSALAAALGAAPEEPSASGDRVLVVLVNLQRPESDIPLRSLVRIFRGEQRFWDNGDRVYPVLPPEDLPGAREDFLAAVVKLDSRGFALHWRNLLFRGDATDQPISPPDEKHAVQTVFAERGAIALVAGSGVKNLGQVAKVLTVNGVDRGTASYALKWRGR